MVVVMRLVQLLFALIGLCSVAAAAPIGNMYEAALLENTNGMPFFLQERIDGIRNTEAMRSRVSVLGLSLREHGHASEGAMQQGQAPRTKNAIERRYSLVRDSPRRGSPAREYPSALIDLVEKATSASVVVFSVNLAQGLPHSVASAHIESERPVTGPLLRTAKKFVLSQSAYRQRVNDKTSCAFWPRLGIRFANGAGEVWWLAVLSCGVSILVRKTDIWADSIQAYLTEDAIVSLRRLESGEPVEDLRR
jgi:hypothetical protein